MLFSPDGRQCFTDAQRWQEQLDPNG